MKIILRLLLISLTFILCSSCSKEDSTNPLYGTWELTTWTVDIPFDYENDEVANSNFLDRTNCEVNETLSFDKNGTVTSNDTFNPEIIIRLKDGTSDIYFLEETCAEGSIGFSVSFVQMNTQVVEFNNAVGVVADKQLTIVYENAIKIYNESLTEVIEEKNLTLVYTRD